MKKTAKIIFSLVVLVTVFSVAIMPQARANVLLDGLTKTVEGTDLSNGTTGINLPIVIGKIIQIFLSFLGVIAVIIIIYAGFLWMTAGGDSGKIEKAKSYIKNAVIGVVIILTSYIITSYVIEQVSKTIKA
ncbi:hypothetical protein GW933_03825 [Candidatus Falkowbacteria bacterium]|uniref:TrbC/VIRB2 family protein n=1 Tax=Candidatus Buchananbacteria bacterium CG10_big_fil_rev_8_21_14_0_10_33_19 TaxID=1974525 RepID=A0A2H0W5A0_9BACT|nr:hypothetical protein [Candidatus Falkowbacteria bacterium]PIS06528.1 MAG: hypothetical protein COT80_00190 [Candidatus Buchananbacteria bacterium CG10_big_fil_rev_8_21_14_0_10_33_19]